MKKIKNPANCEVRAVIQFLNVDSAWDGFIHLPYSPDLASSDYHCSHTLGAVFGLHMHE
jgi:hypothetical protein